MATLLPNQKTVALPDGSVEWIGTRSIWTLGVMTFTPRVYGRFNSSDYVDLPASSVSDDNADSVIRFTKDRYFADNPVIKITEETYSPLVRLGWLAGRIDGGTTVTSNDVKKADRQTTLESTYGTGLLTDFVVRPAVAINDGVQSVALSAQKAVSDASNTVSNIATNASNTVQQFNTGVVKGFSDTVTGIFKSVLFYVVIVGLFIFWMMRSRK